MENYAEVIENFGWGARIRTSVTRSRVLCPTARRPPNDNLRLQISDRRMEIQKLWLTGSWIDVSYDCYPFASFVKYTSAPQMYNKIAKNINFLFITSRRQGMSLNRNSILLENLVDFQRKRTAQPQRRRKETNLWSNSALRPHRIS